MSPSREDDAPSIADLERELHRRAIEIQHLQETVAAQAVTIARLCRWLGFARQQVATRDEHLAWAEEKVRVYRRAIERLA